MKTGNTGRVRLSGPEMGALRAEVLEAEDWRCQECGRRVYDDVPDWHPTKAHLAHEVGRGRGGSDTRENVRILCSECHLRFEHSPKVVRRLR